MGDVTTSRTTTDPTAAEALAGFAVAAVHDGVPEAVAASVRQRILDVVGLQVAALSLDTSVFAADFVMAQGGPGQAHVVGQPTPIGAPWAAFANGVLAHSLDYDDTHLPSVLHPSASVVPAAMAAAELAGADGVRLGRAIAAGIETVVRLGMVGYDSDSRNSVFFEHGQHATSICGAVGSAVAAAVLLDGDADAVKDAIGIAASMASGIIEANRTGGTVKRLHCGWAAHAGVSAAMLAQAGFTGPPTALEGRFGFFEAFLHDTGDLAQVFDGLGTTWAVPGIFFKPYPANHFTHTGLDAARQLRERGISPADIADIELGVAAPTVRTIGEPIDAKRAPETGYQAQFSGPYMVAVGLFGGHGLGAGLQDFTDELVHDPDRRALMQRVSVVANPECDEIYPHQFPAILRVRLRDGDEVEVKVLANRGGPDNPLSEEELAIKYRHNVAEVLDDTVASQIEHAVCALDEYRPGEIMELLASASSGDRT